VKVDIERVRRWLGQRSPMTPGGPDYALCMGRSAEEELAKLADDGLDPEARIWITHFFGHFGSTASQRESFRDELAEAGFGSVGRFAEIGSAEEVEGDELWHHWTFTVFAAEPEILVRADEAAQRIANAHGVRYDGWMVQRRPLDGPPRLEADE